MDAMFAWPENQNVMSVEFEVFVNIITGGLKLKSKEIIFWIVDNLLAV